MKKAVMCIVRTRAQAEDVVEQLYRAGFSTSDISVLFPDDGTRELARGQGTMAPEGAIGGAGLGGVVGGTFGLLAGIGALVIPGVGPLIAAGPLMAALSGVVAGATVGGVTGALAGMGIPETEARQLEGKLRGGSLLVSVHVESSDARARAENIFRAARAEDISTVKDTNVPEVSPSHPRM